MLTAKEIFSGKMQSVMAKDLNCGDFVFYIGKWSNKVNAFVDACEMVTTDGDKVTILKVRVYLDSGEKVLLFPDDHVICFQDKSSGEDKKTRSGCARKRTKQIQESIFG